MATYHPNIKAAEVECVPTPLEQKYIFITNQGLKEGVIRIEIDGHAAYVKIPELLHGLDQVVYEQVIS